MGSRAKSRRFLCAIVNSASQPTQQPARIAHRRRATMKALCVPACVILTLVCAAVPLSAHHSWPVSFDRLVTVKGRVIDFVWANPHPMMTLEVESNEGRTEKWTAGGPAIIRMEANGW